LAHAKKGYSLFALSPLPYSNSRPVRESARLTVVPRARGRRPQGFHRIRRYGLFASGTRADNIARARELPAVGSAVISASQALRQH